MRLSLLTPSRPRQSACPRRTPTTSWTTLTRRGLVALGAALALGVTSCTSDDEEYQGMFGWIEGDKPLEERQTIEDYQATVEAQLAQFVQTMQAESGGAVLIAPSKVRPRLDDGHQMTTAIVAFDHPVSYTRARELAGQLFPAVGLTTITEHRETVMFHDEPNGGFMSLRDNHERGIAIYGTSGTRPSTQADPRAARVVPEWEAALPLDPSVDPTSTWTPTPPPTQG